ncbi:hypothetical protein SAMN06265222_101617 [Neorhodopirellula lusitana]|uniref:Uncharacterized protein n=1 Tax=Neorhodopirellula lusitana TaxID=445327 RepID=A0ABY1PPP5_9BACT|nr:hypothetical protein SAMN06265222_101617 [Neorhodopirellula lusitana]
MMLLSYPTATAYEIITPPTTILAPPSPPKLQIVSTMCDRGHFNHKQIPIAYCAVRIDLIPKQSNWHRVIAMPLSRKPHKRSAPITL